MDEQLKDAEHRQQPVGDHKPSIDPLRRVFVPRERVNQHGVTTFRTTDMMEYYRMPGSNSIMRRFPKVNGKAAKKARHK